MAGHRRIAAVAVALVVVAPGVASGQRISVSYVDAPLSAVVQNLAAYTGRSIVLAQDAGDPRVTASLRNVDWQRGLEQIVGAQALVARVEDSGIIRIERPRFVSVTYLDAALGEVVRNFAEHAQRTIDLPPGVADLKVTASFENIEWRRALDELLAAHGLVARVDANGAMRVDRRPPR